MNTDQMHVVIPSKFLKVTQGIQPFSNLPLLLTFDCRKLRIESIDMPLHVTNMHSLDLSHGINSKSCPLIRDWTQHMHRMAAEVSNSVPSQFSHPLTSSNSEEGRDNQIIITQGKSGAVTKGYDTLIKGADGKINIVLMDGSSNCKYHTKNRAVDRIHKNTYHYQSQRDMPHHPNKHTFGTNLDNMHGAYDRKKAILLTMENCNRLSDKGQEKPKWDKSPTFVKKTKQIDCDQIGNTKQKRNKFVENMEKTPSVSNNIEQEPFPEFESFIVEEQEGSSTFCTLEIFTSEVMVQFTGQKGKLMEWHLPSNVLMSMPTEIM